MCVFKPKQRHVLGVIQHDVAESAVIVWTGGSDRCCKYLFIIYNKRARCDMATYCVITRFCFMQIPVTPKVYGMSKSYFFLKEMKVIRAVKRLRGMFVFVLQRFMRMVRMRTPS